MDDIKITAVSPDDSQGPQCGLCLAEASRYTCPRCNIRYCSSACYRCAAHAQCSETFYRNCVMDELRMDGGGEDKRKMMEILRRCADLENKEQEPEADDDEVEESDDDDADDDDLTERLQSIDLEAEDVDIWNSLPESSRQNFVRMLKSGKLAHLVEAWTPWWTSDSRIEVMNEGREESDKAPPLLLNVPMIDSLVSRPSPAVQYGVIAALYAYVYSARLFNGEHNERLSWEASHVIVSIMSDSAVLVAATTDTIDSLSSVVSACVESMNDRDSREMSVYVLDDVVRIVRKGSRAVASALSDCHGVLYRAKRDAPVTKQKNKAQAEHCSDAYRAGSESHAVSSEDNKDTAESRITNNRKHVRKDKSDRVLKSNKVKSSKETTQESEMKQHVSQCFRLRKKLEFLISWTVGGGSAMLEDLVPALEVEFCCRSSDLVQLNSDKQKVEEMRSNPAFSVNTAANVNGKSLIQEL